MKIILGCMAACTLTLSAQSALESMLTKGLEQAAKGIVPINAEDQKVVVAQASSLLQKHVTFRADGTSSSFADIGASRQAMEWKNLRIKTIRAPALTEADRSNGIEKRYLAIIDSDAYRAWDAKTNQWTEWKPTMHPLFPKGINVEWKNGQASASSSEYLSKFFPGPGTSIVESQNEPPKVEKSPQLPPGVNPAK